MEARRRALLNLEYDDLLASCNIPFNKSICDDPTFWEEKAQIDYGQSLRAVRGQKGERLTPQNKYLSLLSREDVARGSECFIDPSLCLERAIITGRDDLTDYFVNQVGVDINTLLIEAAGDKERFDQLIQSSGVNIYAEPNLLFEVVVAATRSKNFPLLKELNPEAGLILRDNETREIILNEAAATGDYDFVNFIHQSYYLGNNSSEDEWLLQTALLNGDHSYAEDLIHAMLEERKYLEAALAFIRSGEYDRLEHLVTLLDLEDQEMIGYYILINAVKYNRLSMVKLIIESPSFTLNEKEAWTQQALTYTRSTPSIDNNIVKYLENMLRITRR